MALLPSRRALFPVLVPVCVLLLTGVRGVDFGFHWDERLFQVAPVKHKVETGVPLPNHFGYPSLTYWVNAAVILPDVPAALASPGPRERILAAMDGPVYLLRLRLVFLVLASLAVVWVYALVLRWRGSRAEACLAAALLGLSWEVAYHARWVSTDTLLMQFGALTALLTMGFWLEPHRRNLLYLAAVAAGLGFGTKYPGGLLVFPVLIAAARSEPGWRPRPGRLAGVVAVFTATYLATTPATLVRPLTFLRGVLYEVRHYATGHGGHTIAPGWEHAGQMLVYFGSVFFSAFAPLAVAVFALSLIGLFAVLREGARGVLFLSFPVLYFTYFATQSVMLVRNLLVLAPFGAVLAARGAAWLWERQRGAKLLRPALLSLLTVVLLGNAAWLVYAAETIVHRRSDRFVREAAAWMSQHEQESVWVSPRVQVQMAALGLPLPARAVAEPSQARRLVLYATEGMAYWKDWPANRPGLTERWFGPHEVNFNIYPNWWGDDRILVISGARARAIDLLPIAVDRFHARAAHAKLEASPPARAHAPGSHGRIDPCDLVTADEVEREIGRLILPPKRGMAVNGRGCKYAGEDVFVAVGVLRNGTAVFGAQKAELGGVVDVEGLGDAAYWHTTGPGEIALFGSTQGTAYMIRVTASKDPPLERAVRLARLADWRLRGAR